MKLILGSTSSARALLLKGLGLSFETKSPNFDERSLEFNGNPIQYVKDLAYSKNSSIIKNPGDLVITCDTVVFVENKVFNKPESYEEAYQMIRSLSGTTHEVITGVCVSDHERVFVSHESTSVTFNNLTNEHIEIFLQDPLYLHRSGAYTLSGKGALLIKSLKGSYENVIGIPFNTLNELLGKWDLTLWE